MGNRLKGYSVLVTRPQPHAAGLCAAVEREGGQAIAAPMLEIEAAPESIPMRARIRSLDEYQHLIFISRNAAVFGMSRIARENVNLTHQQVYAVGSGTAAALEEVGVEGVRIPPAEFTSEGLLKLDEFQSAAVKGARVLIFRGVGGREYLADGLTKRGAIAEYCEIYERRAPQICLAKVFETAGVTVPDIAVMTSLAGLTNFVDKIAEEGLNRLFDMPVIAVGARMAKEVKKLGFTKPAVIVDNPNDQNIIDTLKRWVVDEI